METHVQAKSEYPSAIHSNLHVLAAEFDGETTGRPQSYLPASPIPAFRLTYKPNFSYL